jgi:hypothetical protein
MVVRPSVAVARDHRERTVIASLPRLGFFLLSITVLAPMFSGASVASTYSCTAVDSKASVGVKDGESVSVVTDTSRKTCSFSVSGATVDQRAPVQDFVAALNTLLSGGFDRLSRGETRGLADLLVGPDQSRGGSDVERALNDYVSEISSCISSARQYSDTISFTSGPTSFERGDVSCKVLPVADSPVRSFGQVEVIASDPILQIGVQSGRQTYLVFLSFQLLERGKRGFRISPPPAGRYDRFRK